MASKDGVDPRFPYRCSCGAAVDTAEARKVCPSCGKTIEVLGTIQTPRGAKYKLRIKNSRKHPAVERSNDVKPAESHLGNRFNNYYFRLGVMILVFTASFTIFVITIGQDGFVKSTTRPPGDCDFYARPIGNKHCHYEGTPMRDPQEPGTTQIKWTRVND